MWHPHACPDGQTNTKRPSRAERRAEDSLRADLGHGQRREWSPRASKKRTTEDHRWVFGRPWRDAVVKKNLRFVKWCTSWCQLLWRQWKFLSSIWKLLFLFAPWPILPTHWAGYKPLGGGVQIGSVRTQTIYRTTGMPCKVPEPMFTSQCIEPPPSEHLAEQNNCSA